MPFPFQISEHVIDGQYIREYPRATAAADSPLKLCIKQYTPIDNPNPQPGDVTIVATHGTGFPKELYEPLWEELLARSKQDGVRIRGIWMADAANQGASGILNEDNLGNDPSWHDHSRDVVHMINHFRDQMPRPIIGVGHSLGAVQLLFASLFHPRLFTSLALIEPHMTDNPLAGDGPLFVAMSTAKRDVWPSREAAAEKSRKVLKAWDPRVFELWKKHGYRELPTALHPQTPKDGSSPVTLTTTKQQETIMYTRPNVNRHVHLGVPHDQAHTDPDSIKASTAHDPLVAPDVLGPLLPDQKSYRPEPILAYKLVPHIRPSVLYISASHSPLGKGGQHAEAAKQTGTGFGGSGGMDCGRVKLVTIPKAGHTLPQEKVVDTAQVLGPWIKQELQRWRQDEERIYGGWRDRPISEKSNFPDEWREVIESLPLPKRPAKM
ncbi:hypothetical protein N7452_010959 [Penicillium brevicompactum]|uniref:AB hydrolase-1 domain-containing protein n=1 Tax=Penicillium brevicompactum TaxID=5074 RepID=A0A9W9U6H9_PENBR|nr:hypothetical protein N7452_010959 [Penicillium brevicompactum]